MRTTSWKEFAQFILHETGCKPFSGAGINPRPKQFTTLLRSVDDTYYYADDLSDKHLVNYTLFGHNGDQDEHEKKMNEPLLNINKTKHIYIEKHAPNTYGMVNMKLLTKIVNNIQVKIAT